MKINIIEEDKSKIVFTVEGETHTLCNVLVKELNKDKDVTFAAYQIDHPLVGVPEIIVNGKDVKKSLKTAIKSVTDQAKEFEKLI